MTGVFISYSRADEALAKRITLGLRALGAEVWWDQDMPSVDWQRELERRINELAAVVVLWTPRSAESQAVNDEARLGRQRGKLVNLLAGVAEPPFPFDAINGLMIGGWTGREPHPGWTRLVASIDNRLATEGAIQPRALIDAQQRLDAEIASRRAALDAATRTRDSAHGEHDRASVALDRSEEVLARAQSQYAGLKKLDVSDAVLDAARAELDVTRDALTAAREARGKTLAALERESAALAALAGAHDSWLISIGVLPRESQAESEDPAQRIAEPVVARAEIAASARARAETPPVPPPPPVAPDPVPATPDAAAVEPEPHPFEPVSLLKSAAPDPPQPGSPAWRVPAIAIGAAAAAGVLWLLLSPSDEPMPGNASVVGTPPEIAETTAPELPVAWLAGRWGMGDCTVQIAIEQTGSSVTLSMVGESDRETQAIVTAGGDRIETENTVYTRDPSGVSVDPRDDALDNYRLTPCPA